MVELAIKPQISEALALPGEILAGISDFISSLPSHYLAPSRAEGSGSVLFTDSSIESARQSAQFTLLATDQNRVQFDLVRRVWFATFVAAQEAGREEAIDRIRDDIRGAVQDSVLADAKELHIT